MEVDEQKKVVYACISVCISACLQLNTAEGLSSHGNAARQRPVGYNSMTLSAVQIVTVIMSGPMNGVLNNLMKAVMYGNDESSDI